MKKVNVLQLIASICLFIVSIINLLNILIGIPYAVHVFELPLAMVSVILLCIVIVQKIKLKKSQQSDDSN